MDKTYCETVGHIPFDWNQALSPKPTDEQWKQMALLSFDWRTCPCANQSAIVPRCSVVTGLPLDHIAACLGVDFHVLIGVRRRIHAKRKLVQIEARFAVLKAHELAKLNLSESAPPCSRVDSSRPDGTFAGNAKTSGRLGEQEAEPSLEEVDRTQRIALVPDWWYRAPEIDYD